MATYLARILSSEYSVLPPDIPLSYLYDVSMHPLCPALFAAAYVLLVSQFNARRPCQNLLKSPWASALVLAHNVFLCLYSLWTFMKIAPPVVTSFAQGYWKAGSGGFIHAYCDSDSFLWDQYILRYGYLFYLSKFYEVVDTAILLLKGTKVKPLQVYHHSGAIAAMYAGVRFQSTPILFFVLFNSFIHALMYCYYATSVLKWPFPRFLKQSLTTLQISQFVLGTILAPSYIWISLPKLDLPGFVRESGRCMEANSVQAFAVFLNIAYLIPLCGLFVRFYKQSYGRRAKLA